MRARYYVEIFDVGGDGLQDAYRARACSLATRIDVKMAQRDEAAMQEGAKNAGCVIAIVSGPAGDDAAYFRRSFCLSELRWAKEAGISTFPVVSAEDNGQITELVSDIPHDLSYLKGVNCEHIVRTDVDDFKLGITNLIRARAQGSR